MKRALSAGRDQSSVIWLLVGSFVLTIASFVAATLVSEQRARGIEVAAEGITTNALPSIGCLTQTRTGLRQMVALLVAAVGTESASPRRPTDAERADVDRSRRELADAWSRCLALPTFFGERALQERIDMRLAELNRSVDTLLAAADAERTPEAFHELNGRVQPLAEGVDTALVEEIDLNAAAADELGRYIARMRASSNRLRTFLITLSALLASAAAFFMARVIRRFTTLMQTRVSEMEHFAGRVAHDVRSPLASVSLVLDLMKREPERTISRGMLERASATVQRIGQLVDALLVFARSGETPERDVSTNVYQIVTAVIEEMHPSAESAGVSLELAPPDRDARVACSSGVLISLVSNLVGNAIKHMGSSPVRRVLLRVVEREDALRFEVGDTGPGVPPALRARIFDPYVRAAESAVPGIGLGLATVRRLAEAHGGAVGLTPNDGPGSTFWFELPKGVAAPSERRRSVRALFVSLRGTARG